MNRVAVKEVRGFQSVRTFAQSGGLLLRGRRQIRLALKKYAKVVNSRPHSEFAREAIPDLLALSEGMGTLGGWSNSTDFGPPHGGMHIHLAMEGNQGEYLLKIRAAGDKTELLVARNSQYSVVLNTFILQAVLEPGEGGRFQFNPKDFLRYFEHYLKPDFATQGLVSDQLVDRLLKYSSGVQDFPMRDYETYFQGPRGTIKVEVNIGHYPFAAVEDEQDNYWARVPGDPDEIFFQPRKPGTTSAEFFIKVSGVRGKPEGDVYDDVEVLERPQSSWLSEPRSLESLAGDLARLDEVLDRMHRPMKTDHWFSPHADWDKMLFLPYDGMMVATHYQPRTLLRLGALDRALKADVGQPPSPMVVDAYDIERRFD